MANEFVVYLFKQIHIEKLNINYDNHVHGVKNNKMCNVFCKLKLYQTRTLMIINIRVYG